MPSSTSCRVTLSRNEAIWSPSASHSPCVRQRWPGHAGLGRLAAAARHAHVLFDRRHDLGDADGGRPAGPGGSRRSARARSRRGRRGAASGTAAPGRPARSAGARRSPAAAAQPSAPYLARSAMAMTAYLPRVFNSTTPGSYRRCVRPQPATPHLRSTPLPVLCDTPHDTGPADSSERHVRHALSNCSKLHLDIWKFRARKSSIFAARAKPVRPAAVSGQAQPSPAGTPSQPSSESAPRHA